MSPCWAGTWKATQGFSFPAAAELGWGGGWVCSNLGSIPNPPPWLRAHCCWRVMGLMLLCAEDCPQRHGLACGTRGIHQSLWNPQRKAPEKRLAAVEWWLRTRAKSLRPRMSPRSISNPRNEQINSALFLKKKKVTNAVFNGRQKYYGYYLPITNTHGCVSISTFFYSLNLWSICRNLSASI